MSSLTVPQTVSVVRKKNIKTGIAIGSATRLTDKLEQIWVTLTVARLNSLVPWESMLAFLGRRGKRAKEQLSSEEQDHKPCRQWQNNFVSMETVNETEQPTCQSQAAPYLLTRHEKRRLLV